MHLNLRAIPAPEWERLFHRRQGWIGSDCAYTVPLSQQRILWLFGDTYWGEVRDGERVNATLVMGNSIAIQQGKHPQSAHIEFLFGKPREGKPTAFLAPRTAKGWFWFGHGIAEGKHLWLFLTHIVPTGEPGVFGFRSEAVWLAEVHDCSLHPSRWCVDLHRLPFYQRTANTLIAFGSAVWSDGRWTYIYGTRDDRTHTPLKRGLLIARAPAGRLSHFTRWQFWCDGKWSSAWRDSAPAGEDIGAEFSVSFVPTLRRWVLVYSPATLAPEIRVRWAQSPTGAWSEPHAVYRCPDVQVGRHVFCYAAKAHPELSAEGELLVTYATNSFEWSEVLRDARLYVPRFIRLQYFTTQGNRIPNHYASSSTTSWRPRTSGTVT